MPYKDKNKQREYQRLRVAKRRFVYVQSHGGMCTKCSSVDSLEFHHVNKHSKVSHRIWSWSVTKLESELVKCELLCKNCHFTETAKERGYYSSPHGTLTSYKNYKCRCKDCRQANASRERRRRQTHVIQGNSSIVGHEGQLLVISTIPAEQISIC